MTAYGAIGRGAEVNNAPSVTKALGTALTATAFTTANINAGTTKPDVTAVFGSTLPTALKAKGGYPDSLLPGGAFYNYSFWSPAGVGKTIAGTVTVLGLPASKTIRVYDQNSGTLLAQGVSSAVDGSFTYGGLPPGRLVYVIALAPSTFDALIFGQVQPA